MINYRIKLYTSAYLALKQQELWLGKRAYKKAEQTPYVYAYLIDRTSIELFYMTGSRQGNYSQSSLIAFGIK
jgi:hypothetical protein